MSRDSYSARAAQRAYDNLVTMKANEAKARRHDAQQDAVAEAERQTRAVEAEFVRATSPAERMELLVRAARAEFDRANAHALRRYTKRSEVNRAVRLNVRAFELVDGLYERRDSGRCLAGGEWHDAFAELAKVRSQMTAFEADLRRSR